MNITSRADFAADPQTVYAMLVDPGYQDRLVAASNPIDAKIDVGTDEVTTTRTLPAPADAARFTGPQIVIVENLKWGAAGADGSRTGTITMTVPKQPVTMKGTVQLGPGGRGTVVTLTGDLKVNIPLLGKKMEASAAPAVLAAFEDHQKVGDAWLAEH